MQGSVEAHDRIWAHGQTFAGGGSLTLARLVRARIIVLVITVDLKCVSTVLAGLLRATYDATTRAGTTLHGN